MVRVALVQTRSSVGTETCDPREANLERTILGMREAASAGAQLAVFGEMHLSGYRTDEYLWKYASVVDPPDTHVRALEQLARETGLYVIVGAATFGRGMPGDVYNSALLI